MPIHSQIGSNTYSLSTTSKWSSARSSWARTRLVYVTIMRSGSHFGYFYFRSAFVTSASLYLKVPINLTLNAWRDPLQCLLKIIWRFLEQSTTRGEVGTTCCSPKSELRRQGSLFILMDLNFLIILQVKWRILSQLWFLKLVFWNYIDQKFFSYLLSFCISLAFKCILIAVF